LYVNVKYILLIYLISYYVTFLNSNSEYPSYNIQPVQKMDKSDQLLIPAEIESELKFISRGIISFYVTDRLFFFFVSEQQEIELIGTTNNISLELDPILRDEFPSVRVIFTFYIDKLKVKNLDYYISLESNDEIKHLQQLYDDRNIVFVLYSGSVQYIKKYEIGHSDLELIKKVIDEIDYQVDKAGQFNDNKPSI